MPIHFDSNDVLHRDSVSRSALPRRSGARPRILRVQDQQEQPGNHLPAHEMVGSGSPSLWFGQFGMQAEERFTPFVEQFRQVTGGPVRKEGASDSDSTPERQPPNHDKTLGPAVLAALTRSRGCHSLLSARLCYLRSFDRASEMPPNTRASTANTSTPATSHPCSLATGIPTPQKTAARTAYPRRSTGRRVIATPSDRNRTVLSNGRKCRMCSR